MNAPARPAETVAPHRFTYDDVADGRGRADRSVSRKRAPGCCRRWLTQFLIRRLAEGGYDLVGEISKKGEIAPLAFPDLAIRVRDLPALD